MRHLVVATLAILALAPAWAADEPIAVGDRTQLFIDKRFIASSEGITLRMQQAQKLGRITDENGEYIREHVSRLMEIDGVIRLYVGVDELTILESTDGMTFARKGEVRAGAGATIFFDEHDPDPARRYKLFVLRINETRDPAVEGVYASSSPDGITFTEPHRVLPLFTDNPNIVWWDARIGKYVIYTRALALDSENQRRVARIEVDDPLAPWPYRPTPNDGLFFTTDNADVVLQADELDNPHSDIYYNAATIYPWAQDVYLMFTAQFRHYLPDVHPFIRPNAQGRWEDFGLLEIQLATSRDGIQWNRPSREPYFPTGLADEWDRWYAVMCPGIVRRGNYLYQYYVSSGRTHDSNVVRAEYDYVTDLGGIGAVRQTFNRFVAANADEHGGWIETPAITFEGNRLRLNIDTGSMGIAFVEIRDANGTPIPGYTLTDCEEIGGNYLDQTVYWNGNHDVAPLAGTPIKLHVQLNRGSLYAFTFTNE